MIRGAGRGLQREQQEWFEPKLERREWFEPKLQRREWFEPKVEPKHQCSTHYRVEEQGGYSLGSLNARSNASGPSLVDIVLILARSESSLGAGRRLLIASVVASLGE